MKPDEREAAWRRFVAEYPVEVSEEEISNEMSFIELSLRHGMQYDRLTGGDPHLFPSRELESQRDELREAAVFEAKAPKVVRDLVGKLGLTATRDELELEAENLATRQGTTVEMVKRFFGEDLAMLERDVLERKAVDWACEQVR